MGIEGMDGLLLLFTAIASRDWAVWVRFQDFLPPSKINISPVPLDAAEFSAACLYSVFGIHMEALDGY